MAMFAFAVAFTTFLGFDDEGYFLQAYRQFLSGHVLYDQVFAWYGPFTFYCAAILARFDAVNVTHDNFRWAYSRLDCDCVAFSQELSGVGQVGTPALVAFLLVGFL
jgi:hypothetical protein